MAKVLTGCFRTGEANDPVIYADAVMAVLSDYPFDVVRSVVDPRTGIPSRSKWLPTVAEVKEELEGIMAKRARDVERERRVAKQLEDRERDERINRERAASGEEARVAAKFNELAAEMKKREAERLATEIAERKARRESAMGETSA